MEETAPFVDPAGLASVLAQANPLDVLRFWEGFETQLVNLVQFAVGIALYGLFIYFFYEYFSRRNLLGHHLLKPGRGILAKLVGAVQYVLLFPVISFAFFIVLSFSFFFLATQPGDMTTGSFIRQIMFLAMAVVTSVRITAYISESTSHDIAKLLPLGLLGVFLVRIDLGVDRLEQALLGFESFLTFEVLTGIVLRYFLFLLVLEVGLRVVFSIIRPGGTATREAKRRRKREEELQRELDRLKERDRDRGDEPFQEADDEEPAAVEDYFDRPSKRPPARPREGGPPSEGRAGAGGEGDRTRRDRGADDETPAPDELRWKGGKDQDRDKKRWWWPFGKGGDED